MANVFPLSFPPRPNNPSPFGFGFGGTPSPSATPSSFLPPSTFGSPLRRPPPTPSASSSSSFGRPYQLPTSPSAFGVASPLAYAGSPSLKRKESTSTSPSKRRGRDDDSEEEDEDERERQMRGRTGEQQAGGGGGGGREIAGRRGIKKSRVDHQTSGDQEAAFKREDSPSKPQADDGVDVGVLLALLPPASLLPILTSLVTRHPELKSTLLTLIPTPSLSSALDALRLADEKVRLAVPFGWSPARSAGGAGVSETYVLGRIQKPVGELASLIQSHLPYFTPNTNASIPHHPTTTFPYLQAITTLLLRLSSTLPSPLVPLQLLWPRVAEEWLRWVGAVGDLVNKQGGMVGAGVADGWVRELDALASTGGVKVEGLEARMKSEMSVVRDRWVAEVGWLVNRRVGDGNSFGGDVGMGMDEEL